MNELTSEKIGSYNEFSITELYGDENEIIIGLNGDVNRERIYSL
ncbi:hypothetical protein [Pseudoalteromonas sp. S4389]|nr:hypothetical protein [Pseudoalteromonas sp. S4389]